MLSDLFIRTAIANGEISVCPFPEDIQFQPASIDLRLGDSFAKTFTGRQYDEYQILSPRVIGSYVFESFDRDHITCVTLRPGKCMLASTLEYIELGTNLVARVEGKSTIARQFVAVHITAGFIDPGFKGNITLEIVNHSQYDFVLTPGMPIAQMCFSRVEGRVQRPYGHEDIGSYYQCSKGTVPPKK